MRFSSIIALALATVASAAPITTNGTSTGNGDLVTSYTHCNRPGVFALTFDDGPFQYSWDLAKYLHSKNVKATFFTNGDNFVKDIRTATTTTSDGSKSYLDVLKYYHELGHEIASHTYQHRNLKGLSDDQVQYQMNQQSDLIFDAIGQRPALMRPPEGELDDAASRVLKTLGYSSIMWDVDTKDYEFKGLVTEEGMVRDVVETDVAGQTPGHISLQHDVHESSAKELTPWMIDYITSKNYTFVTVSDCLGLPAYQ
jgi:peptidoglycan/xylan/chitin deacetylase (PgdA/CDA1 family)